MNDASKMERVFYTIAVPIAIFLFLSMWFILSTPTPQISVLLYAPQCHSKCNISDNGTSDAATTTVGRESFPPLYLITPRGRLGNVMFQVAFGLGIAMDNGRPLVIMPYMDTYLKKVFLPPTVEYYSVGVPNRTVSVVYETMGIFGYDQRQFRALEDKPLTISGYSQSWKYFQNIPNDVISDIFTLPTTATVKARNIIENLRKSNTTVVGIHVRRGDYNGKYHYNRGARLPNTSFILKSIDYFRKRHVDVHFVVCSDDPAW